MVQHTAVLVLHSCCNVCTSPRPVKVVRQENFSDWASVFLVGISTWGCEISPFIRGKLHFCKFWCDFFWILDVLGECRLFWRILDDIEVTWCWCSRRNMRTGCTTILHRHGLNWDSSRTTFECSNHTFCLLKKKIEEERICEDLLVHKALSPRGDGGSWVKGGVGGGVKRVCATGSLAYEVALQDKDLKALSSEWPLGLCCSERRNQGGGVGIIITVVVIAHFKMRPLAPATKPAQNSFPSWALTLVWTPNLHLIAQQTQPQRCINALVPLVRRVGGGSLEERGRKSCSSWKSQLNREKMCRVWGTGHGEYEESILRHQSGCWGQCGRVLLSDELLN